MEKIKTEINLIIESLNITVDSLDGLNVTDICNKLGINCFETQSLSLNEFGYISKFNNNISIYINKDIPNNHKKIAIATLIGIYKLGYLKEENKTFVTNKDFNIKCLYYVFALLLNFNHMYVDKLKKELAFEESLINLDKLEVIAKSINISFAHIYNFIYYKTEKEAI